MTLAAVVRDWLPYADESLEVTAELQEVFRSMNEQGGFQVQAIRAVTVSSNSCTNRIVHVKWAGLNKSETIRELLRSTKG